MQEEETKAPKGRSLRPHGPRNEAVIVENYMCIGMIIPR